MLARDIMTPSPICATPADSVQNVAQLMREHRCGCLPVVKGQRDRALVGIVTDRDLALRALALAKPPDTPVGEVMSTGVSCCLDDARVEDVEEIMIQRQVRRVPVLDTTGDCVGIIALGDIARAALTDQTIGDSELGRVVEYVSAPSEQARSDVDVGVYPERLRLAVGAPEQ
jgi:CBS domain-containing protein